MAFEGAPLLSPSGGELRILFEVSRLLGRHTDIGEVLEPLLSLLGDALGSSGGVGALSAGEGSPLRIQSVWGIWTEQGPGVRVEMGEGPLGAALGAERAIGGRDARGEWLSVPVRLRGSTCCALAFRRGDLSSPDARRSSLSLLDQAAVLVAEAVLLRRRLARDSRHDPPEPAAYEPKRDIPESAPGGLIGRSAAMRSVHELIARVGPAESTVLVEGESGTGKELAARALHELSRRSGGPFVAINCAAIPDSLVESELFGHERGAFTGAEQRRRGRFELASGGTLFLDEVTELGLGVQAKLLRVLQERRFERVGGGESLHADVRIVAATNRDLSAEVREGRFREDLFYRLNVFPVKMPPLRDRGGDVILLADHFLELTTRRLGKSVLRISTPALDLLMSYHWPGNVRELENAMERAVLLSSDGVIHAYHLPPSLQSASSTGTGPSGTLDSALARLERELVVEALKIDRGNAAAAARRLGLSERRMGLAMRKYGIEWRRFRTQM